jgi:hypothetical protein
MSGLGEIECKRGLDKILHRELNGEKSQGDDGINFIMFGRDREAKCCDTYESGKAETIRGYSITL